jgi:hypothetical protein
MRNINTTGGQEINELKNTHAIETTGQHFAVSQLEKIHWIRL